jgi:peptidoglycan/LPS O-acetylase OafA/YrhL
MIGFSRPIPSAGDILRAHQGEGPGFNALRLGLSIMILAAHSGWVAGADVSNDWTGLQGILLLSLVPAFFALSGFLVAGSAVRTATVTPFLALRILRIAPALLVEVALSALILGPLITTYPLTDYVRDIRFIEYFGNIVGRVRFELPGVFETNPLPNTVNQNLWTLKPELYCYILLALVIGFGALRRRLLLSALVVSLAGAGTAAALGLGFGAQPGNYHWAVAVLHFLTGFVFYQWRDSLKMHWLLFLGALAAATLLMAGDRALGFLVAPFLSYGVIFIGLLPLKLPRSIHRLDISYGIYLYGFPIQQTLIAKFAVLHGSGPLLFAASLPLAIVFALLSWLWIKKPFLRLKRHFVVPAAGPAATEAVASAAAR